jgi:hypothetical protein
VADDGAGSPPILVQIAGPSFTCRPPAADASSVLRLIHERLAELARRGYRHQPVTGIVRLDERTARDMSCPECFHRGLHFAALAHPQRPGHIALAWCDLCRVAMDVPRSTAASQPGGSSTAAAR